MPVRIDPTVDHATTDTEPEGHIGDRIPPVELEQTERATIRAEIVGRPQLSAEAKPLLGRQSHGVHGSPPRQDNHGEPKGARMDISWGNPENGTKLEKRPRK